MKMHFRLKTITKRIKMSHNQRGDSSVRQKMQQQQRQFIFKSQTKCLLFTAVRRALNYLNLATLTQHTPYTPTPNVYVDYIEQAQVQNRSYHIMVLWCRFLSISAHYVLRWHTHFVAQANRNKQKAENTTNSSVSYNFFCEEKKNNKIIIIKNISK